MQFIKLNKHSEVPAIVILYICEHNIQSLSHKKTCSSKKFAFPSTSPMVHDLMCLAVPLCLFSGSEDVQCSTLHLVLSVVGSTLHTQAAHTKTHTN